MREFESSARATTRLVFHGPRFWTIRKYSRASVERAWYFVDVKLVPSSHNVLPWIQRVSFIHLSRFVWPTSLFINIYDHLCYSNYYIGNYLSYTYTGCFAIIMIFWHDCIFQKLIRIKISNKMTISHRVCSLKFATAFTAEMLEHKSYIWN